ncbi:MBL fold metallo-hydrolase [Georgenia subflava]|uniref:MBL fold metallo-hydrolase n=1 Tax=Georgenia subflava TaxID=1622177 RepID=A0A6N7EI86_9MICO|nr:MBL fold metallo-hydrolase [Georgenia subflava]MPV37141.1 MBL fold metallo-hydrolase [Georgenia subflava]
MELAPGLHRIGNDIVAVHLIVTADGVTVVDAGFSGHYRQLRTELRPVGRDLGDVRGIVLTHGDSDHLGFAERLRAEQGVPVYVHDADAARARGEEGTSPAWGHMRLGPTLRFLAYSAGKGGLRTRHLSEVRTFGDGDVLPLPGDPRIIALPGHSPGSVAVHVPAVRALFVGDALTTRHVLTGSTGPQPAPFTDDPAAAAAALERLVAIDAGWVLPGHGGPWTGGVPALLDAYRSAAVGSS